MASETAQYLDRLQDDVYEWSEENFGDRSEQSAELTALGLTEELEEFKVEVRLLQVGETRIENVMDEAGDVIVYLADIMERRGYLLSDAYARKEPFVSIERGSSPIEMVSANIGILHGSMLKRAQGIKSDRVEVGNLAERRAASGVVRGVELYGEMYGYSIPDICEITWGKVSERDWTTAGDA